MKRIFLIIPFLALSACGDAMTYPAELDKEAQAATRAAATPVGEIAVVPGSTINGGQFTVVGPVEATVGKLTAFHPAPTVAQSEQKLRIEAAELGADAVINAEIGEVGICALSWGCRVSTGTAVKFAN
ncbi:hypothetical protein ACUXV3_10860 [Roseobacteraceae bacterium NS-SX3]